MFSCPSVETLVLDAQKSAHNICFGLEIRKLIFELCTIISQPDISYMYFQSVCSTKALTRLCIRAGLSEPLLVYLQGTKIPLVRS